MPEDPTCFHLPSIYFMVFEIEIALRASFVRVRAWNAQHWMTDQARGNTSYPSSRLNKSQIELCACFDHLGFCHSESCYVHITRVESCAAQ